MKRAVANDEPLLHETCWYVTHKFETHLPIPEFWPEEYSTMVVLWWTLQKQHLSDDVWCQWAMSQQLHTLTDVNEVTIFSFFPDLQVFLSGIIASLHRALPLVVPNIVGNMDDVKWCVRLYCLLGRLTVGPPYHRISSINRTPDTFHCPCPPETPDILCVCPTDAV